MPNSVYQAVFPYPPEIVYHAVADLQCWQWRSDLDGLEIREGGNTFTETAKNGSRTRFTITENQPSRRYAFEMEGEQFTGQWLGEFCAVPGGTRAIFTEKIRMKRWPLRLLAPLFLPLKKMQKTYAIDLMIHLSDHAPEIAARCKAEQSRAPELLLAIPSEAHETQVMAYRQEFAQNGESLHGGARLEELPDYASWLQSIRQNASEETVSAGLVPATTLLCLRKEDGKMVGIIDIRHRLNDYLLQFGDNIGYSIRKSERRKGYAKAMLSLGLTECRNLGLEKVLITCDKENIASAKTILACGGVLENEIAEGCRITQRYWIALQ